MTDEITTVKIPTTPLTADEVAAANAPVDKHLSKIADEAALKATKTENKFDSEHPIFSK